MKVWPILNLQVGIEEVEEDEDGWNEVAVLYCNGEEVWHSKPQYIDRWGDGSQTAEDIVVDKLREIFNAA